MKLFVDANILVSVLNKEYPLFPYTSRIVSLGNTLQYQVYTSPVCLAIAYYFAEKKCKSKMAKQKISLLCNHINIADTTQHAVDSTLQNVEVLDFEDGLEYYSAINSKCDCIVTEDVSDFYFAKIEVLNSVDFFAKYMRLNK